MNTEAATKVRVVVGASHAYACISGLGFSLDVQLHGGCSAVDSLRRRAQEARDEALRLVQRAERMEQAAGQLVQGASPK